MLKSISFYGVVDVASEITPRVARGVYWDPSHSILDWIGSLGRSTLSF